MKVFLAELAKMNVPQYVGADPALLQQYVPLHVAQNLITKAMNSVEASPDDVVPAGELVGDAAKAAALAEDDWRPLSAQDDRGADGQERQEGED